MVATEQIWEALAPPEQVLTNSIHTSSMPKTCSESLPPLAVNGEFPALRCSRIPKNSHYEQLIDVVVEAGKIILSHFQQGRKNAHQDKQDGSPVTIADLEANAFLVKNLRRLYPEIAIVSEENSAEENFAAITSHQVFIVDPLDGTSSFVAGNKEFAVNVALKIGNELVLGIIYLPVDDVLYFADEEVGCVMISQASTQKKIVSLPLKNSAPKDEITIIATKRKDEAEALAKLFARVTQKHKIINVASAIKFCMLCDGRADAYFRAVRLSIWDVAAGFFLVKSCGFEVLDHDGNDLLQKILRDDYLAKIAADEFRVEAFVIKSSTPQTSQRFTKILHQTFELNASQQIAFLENLYLPGYFKNEFIKNAIHRVRHNHDSHAARWGKEGELLILHEIEKILDNAGAHQKNLREFKAKNLCDGFDILFDDEEKFSDHDVENLVFYLAQSAFGRAPEQERCDLATHDWAENFCDEYLRNVQIVGLIDEIKPRQKNYYESWILGAARCRTMTRMQHLKELVDDGVDPGLIRILTGEREMWAEIDTVGGDIDEAKNYMLRLAEENKIALHKENPFVVRHVAGKDRSYLNCLEGERKLTETLMAQEIFYQIFGYHIDAKNVVDSAAKKGKLRPDTMATAKDTAKVLAARIEEEEKNSGKKNSENRSVLIVSNQPYAERQRLSNETQVFLSAPQLRDIVSFDCVGKSAKTSVAIIHSELAALMTERLRRKIRISVSKKLSF